MEDVFVDVADDVCIDTNVGDDVFIDVRDVQTSRSYDKDVKRVVHNHLPEARYRKPSDFVSFRYSRFDRYGSLRTAVKSPIMEMVRDYQRQVDELAASDLAMYKKKLECNKLIKELRIKLQGENIRYRHLWRNIDCHKITVIK